MAADVSFDTVSTQTRAFLTDLTNNVGTTFNRLVALAETPIDDYAWQNGEPDRSPADSLNTAADYVLTSEPSVPLDYAIGQFAGITQPNTDSLNAITITAPTFDAIPNFTLVSPDVVIPASPDASLPAAPSDVPTFNAPVNPTAPTLSFPTLPSFSNVELPSAPVVTLPTMDYIAPATDVTDPTYTFNYSETPYQSDLLDALNAKLLDNITNGGYGIEVIDEARLWDRARERELQAAETAMEEASRQAAARGFMIPPGALTRAVAAAQQGALEKISSLSRDIAIKKADLFVDNRKFTIQMSKEVEQMLISAAGYVAERALNSAKAYADVSISLFNAQLARSKVRIETSALQLQVFETKLRGALAGLEEWKARLEGARVTVAVQQNQVELYKAQLSGVESLVRVYSAQIDANKLLTDIEVAKLTAFRERVNAYVATVQAKSAEFGMFESQIKGQIAKVQAYQANVSAYSATVDAYKAKADIKEIEFKAQVETAKVKLEKVGYDIERYRADVQAADSRTRALTSQAEVHTRAWVARGELLSTMSNTAIKYAESQNSYWIATAHTASSFAVGHLNALANIINTRGNIITNAGKLYADTAAGLAGTISGVTAIVATS
jgi:hypothetical protein